MVYAKYGEIFKKIRVQNKFLLTDFETINISKSVISKFERGETMISFEKLFFALDMMGVTLRDYEYYLNNSTISESEYLVNQVLIAELQQNTEKLALLKDQAESVDWKIALVIKSIEEPLSLSDKNKLHNYFLSLKASWYYSDLCLFFLSIHELRTEDILNILRLFFLENHPILQSERGIYYVVKSCCRAITLLSFRNRKEEANEIIISIQAIYHQESMYLNNLLRFCKGFWLYKFEDKFVGDSMMVQSLNIFKELCPSYIAKYYQDKYERYVSSNTKLRGE
ncbi:Rgg/GadR/MutR family transcriptional regulator [Lactococcus garvieae]|uniref:Rgg/GadR/MutR family transcriptional regulator n=1 Tax=Lactococcus garvieae TaxID=1363 RepID=UPI00254C3A86|nr:Rgg/GadR/MutR family transcriptional regulator [Lactococcus garvieae]